MFEREKMIWITIAIVLFSIVAVFGKKLFNLARYSTPRQLADRAILIQRQFLEELNERHREAMKYYVALRAERLIFVQEKEVKEKQVRRLMEISAPPNQFAKLGLEIARLEMQIARINDHLTNIKNQIQNIILMIREADYMISISQVTLSLSELSLSDFIQENELGIQERDAKRTKESDAQLANGTPVFTAEGGFKIVPGESVKIDDAELQQRLERLILRESPDNLNN